MPFSIKNDMLFCADKICKSKNQTLSLIHYLSTLISFLLLLQYNIIENQMKTTFKEFAFILMISFIFLSCNSRNDNEPVIKFKTSKGDIVVKLYAETPQHRDNFVKLVESGYYNGVLFHRVIRDFMIQAGDPDSRKAKKNQMLGSGDVPYSIPAEIVYPQFFHKRGALAAARQGDDVNPERASSGAQFYLVQGRIFTDLKLDSLELKRKEKIVFKEFSLKWDSLDIKNKNTTEKIQIALRDSIMKEVEMNVTKEQKYKYTPKQRETYKTVGGTPHLDGEYTVFGEVIKGIEVVSNISVVKTNKADRPLDNVRILSATRIR